MEHNNNSDLKERKYTTEDIEKQKNRLRLKQNINQKDDINHYYHLCYGNNDLFQLNKDNTSNCKIFKDIFDKNKYIDIKKENTIGNKQLFVNFFDCYLHVKECLHKSDSNLHSIVFVRSYNINWRWTFACAG